MQCGGKRGERILLKTSWGTQPPKVFVHEIKIYGSLHTLLPLVKAEQSSTFNLNNTAARAIDGNPDTASKTNEEDPAWLRIYLKKKAKVEKVMIEKGYNHDAACVFTVSVYDGEAQTVCGTFIVNPFG